MNVETQAPVTATGELPVDPVTLSVMLSRYAAIAYEMTLTLEYTARTSILSLARDFSCAIYDAQGRQVAMHDCVAGHTMSMHLMLREIHDAFAGDIREGDVFMCNSPYRRNTHVGDLTTAEPVFANGRHVFWSVTRGHQMDTGAFVPSSVVPHARDIYQEGIQIPPVRIVDRGVPCRDVFDIYLANVRYRDLLEGDLQAQLGSIGKGRVRLQELVDEYGADEVLRYVDAMIDYAARPMKATIEAIPDGEYRATIWVDSDAAGRTDVPVEVSVTVSGDHVMIDYDGSAPQSESGVNASYAVMQAAGAIPFMCFGDPDAPHNHGSFGFLEITAPEGTICNARFPASTSSATVLPGDAMLDVVHKAMAAAVPDRVSAGSARCANIPNFAGVDQETGVPWGCMLFNNRGGGGAVKGADGWPQISPVNGLGGIKTQQVEQVEQLYPMHVDEMEIEPDSMGAGEWIGGPGVRFGVRSTHGAMEVITFGDGEANPPHGVLGGTPGIGGGQYVTGGADGPRRYLPANAHYSIDEDQVRVGISSGGGGYGSPLARFADAVRQDVRDGIVSREAAERVFGVVLSDDWDPRVDEAATRALRERLAAKERPPIDPTRPSASDWVTRHMRDGDVSKVRA